MHHDAAGHGGPILIYPHEVLVFLVAAGLIVPLFNRLRVSPVLGFLLVGVLIGPYGLGRLVDTWPWIENIVIADLERTLFIGELGVMFLLFMIGLELSPQRLWTMRRLVFGFGTAQVVMSAIVIGLIAYAFGNSGAASLVLGACLALSSTAIVMQLLTEKQRLGTPAGQASFGVLLFQDLAVVPILFIVGILGKSGEGSVLLGFAAAMAQAIVAIFAIMVIGRLFLQPVFRFVGSARSRELLIAAALLVIGLTAIATQAAGLSMALGAFLAGLLFAETEYRQEIEADIDPFKGLMLGLFFMSVGMRIDLAAFLGDPVLLPASVVGLIVIKGAIVYGLARAFGVSLAAAIETAFLLGPAGEFAFVVVGMALTLGLVPDATAQFMLIIASVTMILTPSLGQIGRQLASGLEAREAAKHADGSSAAPEAGGHIVIAGYGRVGRMLGSLMSEQEVAYIALDTDARAVAAHRRDGASVLYGDASRRDILEKVGIAKAQAIVVTMDSAIGVEKVVRAVRAQWPSVPIYARARDRKHASALLALGARAVVPETIEASLQLGQALLTGLGMPEQTAQLIIERERRNEMRQVENVDPEATPAAS